MSRAAHAPTAFPLDCGRTESVVVTFMTRIKSARLALRNPVVRRLLFVLAMFCVYGVVPAQAHEIRPAVVTVTITADARYEIDIATNLEAMLADVSPQHRDTEESPNARRYDALRALPPGQLQIHAEAFMPGFLDVLRRLAMWPSRA